MPPPGRKKPARRKPKPPKRPTASPDKARPPAPISLDLVQQIVSEGLAPLDEPFEGGPPLLVSAALVNSAEVCAYLVDANADINR